MKGTNVVEYYVCPSCKTENEDYVKYCKKCGTWLLSESFPAKKVIKAPKKSRFGLMLTVVIAALIGFGAYTVYAPPDVTFSKMELGDKYTVSEFVLKRPIIGSPSVVADITFNDNLNNPVDIVAVFYDEADRRVAVASTSIIRQIYEGETTTVKLKFDEGSSVKEVAKVRIEINPISPLETLTRAVDKMNQIR